jgi:hypothetical protein
VNHHRAGAGSFGNITEAVSIPDVVFPEAQEGFFDELVTHMAHRDHTHEKECGTHETHIEIFGRQSQLDRCTRHLVEKEKVQQVNRIGIGPRFPDQPEKPVWFEFKGLRIPSNENAIRVRLTRK